MHVVDHVEGQGVENENVETQRKYREQNKLEVISAGIQMSGGKRHLTWVFKSLTLSCYCSAILVRENKGSGPHQLPSAGLALSPPRTKPAPWQRPRAGNPATHTSRQNALLLQISGVQLRVPEPACAPPVPAWRGLQEALHGTEVGRCHLLRTQHSWWATPADPPSTSSVLGVGLNQPADRDESPSGALLSPVSLLAGDGSRSHLSLLCLNIKERVWP